MFGRVALQPPPRPADAHAQHKMYSLPLQSLSNKTMSFHLAKLTGRPETSLL